MWYCEKKYKQITNEKKSATRRRNIKKKNVAPPRSGTIIQLHAIVYAVIYYDFRTTLWRLSVSNGLIYGLKLFSLISILFFTLNGLREFAQK